MNYGYFYSPDSLVNTIYELNASCASQQETGHQAKTSGLGCAP
jgi:hypothetical protein